MDDVKNSREPAMTQRDSHRARPGKTAQCPMPARPRCAAAHAAMMAYAKLFRLNGDFAAWIGLTPHQNASGGEERRAGVLTRGCRYLRPPYPRSDISVKFK